MQELSSRKLSFGGWTWRSKVVATHTGQRDLQNALLSGGCISTVKESFKIIFLPGPISTKKEIDRKRETKKGTKNGDRPSRFKKVKTKIKKWSMLKSLGTKRSLAFRSLMSAKKSQHLPPPSALSRAPHFSDQKPSRKKKFILQIF